MPFFTMDILDQKIEPRAVNLLTAAESLSISTAKLRQEIDNGQLRVIRIGNRVLIPVAAIDEYVERLSGEGARDRLS